MSSPPVRFSGGGSSSPFLRRFWRSPATTIRIWAPTRPSCAFSSSARETRSLRCSRSESRLARRSSRWRAVRTRDWRVRARNIAAGSLGAGRVGKALAAQQISMARVEDMWPLTLSKEEAAERQARIRNARRRDERRAQRDAERDQRSDRVSRADLEKAQDGRVGAQIRIVIGGTSSNDRRRKEEDDDKADRKQGSDLLDRLGY